MKNFLDLIENKIQINEKIFAGIIGSNPSKGARSPILWNKAYVKLNKKIKMYPLDCKKENIKKLFDELEKNESFIGGAVTNPYKEELSDILGNNQTEESKKIGAINCLYRDNNGKLFGTNTDGEAAIQSLERNFGTIKNQTFLILGTGGTANTILSFIIKKIANTDNIKIVGRNEKKKKKIKDKYKISAIDWNEIFHCIEKIDIIINCTSIGWGDQKKISPISEIILKKIENKKTAIFDLIYDPNPTILIDLCNKYNLKNINGLEMNLEQAVLGFLKTNQLESTKLQEIKEIMKSG